MIYQIQLEDINVIFNVVFLLEIWSLLLFIGPRILLKIVRTFRLHKLIVDPSIKQGTLLFEFMRIEN